MSRLLLSICALISISLIVLAPILLGDAHPRHHIFGDTFDVQPLINASGQVIQMNISVFSGGLVKGSYNSKKYGGICNTNAPHCYGTDGLGNWRFLFTGQHFCVNTCTYTATGDLIVNKPIQLPDGSTTLQLYAILYGTYVSDSGVVRDNVMAYYNSYTDPAVDSTTALAYGGLTIVFQDN